MYLLLHTLILCILSLCAPELRAQGGPPGNYNWILNPANGHYYAVPAAAMDWNTAKNLADSLGESVELATIRSAEENAWLVGNLIASPAWIGFTDEAEEGVWVWRSGEAVSYDNWAPGEPNDDGAGQDACVVNMPDAASFADDFTERNHLALLEWQPEGGLTLGKLGLCAGPVSLEVRRASPDGQVAFLYGHAGIAIKPTPPCAGIVLALARPHFGATFVADMMGSIFMTFNLPVGACGMSVQVVDLATCTVSNSVVL